MHPIAEWLLQLQRQGRTVRLTLATKCEFAAFSAEPSKCHDNVDRWVEAHPGEKAAYGWLISAAPAHQSLCCARYLEGLRPEATKTSSSSYTSPRRWPGSPNP